MRIYEIVYIFDPQLDEAAIGAKMDRFHDLVTGTDGAEVIEVDHWGARQLAYPIGGQQLGYYVVAHVRCAPEALTEFERVLKLDNDLLRFLVVVNEGEPTDGASIMADRPEGISGSRNDEEEEEDDDDDGRSGEGDDEDDDESESQSDGTPPEFSGGKGRRRRVEGPSIELLNYKDVTTLSRFMTEEGKILPKRTTKVTAGFQRKLGRAVKRARFVGLVPYVRNQEV